MSPFDFVNDASHAKKNILTSENEASYVPFIINRAFSYYIDTLFYANDMSQYPDLDKAIQYQYYISTLRPKKRFAKWAKPVDPNDLELVQAAFGYNMQRAIEALTLLTKEDIEQLKNEASYGATR